MNIPAFAEHTDVSCGDVFLRKMALPHAETRAICAP